MSNDEMYPNKCKMLDFCINSLSGKDFKECSNGENQCSKWQMVVIDYLDDILSEIRSRFPEPDKPHIAIYPDQANDSD